MTVLAKAETKMFLSIPSRVHHTHGFKKWYIIKRKNMPTRCYHLVHVTFIRNRKDTNQSFSPTIFDINLLTYISVFGAIWYHYILKFFVPLSFFCSNFWKIAILKFSENFMKDKFLICTCKKEDM